ncbi:polymer-forming cytoskeletal protein [Lysinibacillus capsici]|uniref:polymer-forming cytoskeletal protein n=1 Tax=Lysinibacillus capsici TaxID=2115968 RepID=UPI002DC006D3|nr:polymer-forming cytoskeletal protein [Lysinibacillus capsici]MEC1301784.1 polymer-forming cytoskeletal protein [Lysinibacillus capsici]
MRKNKIVVLKNENGYAFLLVFFTIILISVLGLSILKVSSNTLKTSDHERDDQSVYYIAEAGLNYGREHTRKNFEIAESLATTEYQKQKIAYEKKQDPNPPDFKGLLKIELENLGYPANDNNIKKTILIKSEDPAIQDIESRVRDKVNYIPFLIPTFDDQFGLKPKVRVSITLEDADDLRYRIESIGEFEDTSIKRTLQQIITMKLDYTDSSNNPSDDDDAPTEGSGGGHFVPHEYTVQTKGDIILNGGGKIIGNVASAGGKVKLTGGTEITGNIGVSPENLDVPEYLNKFKNQTTQAQDFPAGNALAPFPEDRMNDLAQLNYPPNEELIKSSSNKTNIIYNGNFQADNWMASDYTLNLSGDTHFKEFKVGQNNTITINIGDSDKDLYIEDLNILQGHIKIIGTGKLNIYVKDSLHIKGSFNNGGDVSQINFLYSGSKPLTLSNETQLNGSLYAKEADLTFSGGVGVKGNIYSGGNNITFNGGFNSEGQHIIAPNADVKVVAGAHIKGAIVADTILVDGGASITFSESNASNGNGGNDNNNKPNIPPSPPKVDITEDIILET